MTITLSRRGKQWGGINYITWSTPLRYRTVWKPSGFKPRQDELLPQDTVDGQLRFGKGQQIDGFPKGYGGGYKTKDERDTTAIGNGEDFSFKDTEYKFIYPGETTIPDTHRVYKTVIYKSPIEEGGAETTVSWVQAPSYPVDSYEKALAINNEMENIARGVLGNLAGGWAPGYPIFQDPIDFENPGSGGRKYHAYIKIVMRDATKVTYAIPKMPVKRRTAEEKAADAADGVIDEGFLDDNVHKAKISFDLKGHPPAWTEWKPVGSN